MSTFTKEWLQKAISDIETMRDEIPFGLAEDERNTLAALKLALASLEAQPVGEVVLGEYDDCGCHPDAMVACIAADGQAEWENFKDGTRLYTAPPAPVSVPIGRTITQHFDTIALETAREIMCDVNRRHEFLGGELQLLSRIQCRIDDACRAAMLQCVENPESRCGNSPVIPGGWVACSERMPETEGHYLVWATASKLDGYCDHMAMASYRGGEWSNEFNWLVTHWMPLPAAPQQED